MAPVSRSREWPNETSEDQIDESEIRMIGDRPEEHGQNGEDVGFAQGVRNQSDEQWIGSVDRLVGGRSTEEQIDNGMQMKMTIVFWHGRGTASILRGIALPLSLLEKESLHPLAVLLRQMILIDSDPVEGQRDQRMDVDDPMMFQSIFRGHTRMLIQRMKTEKRGQFDPGLEDVVFDGR